MKVQAVERFSLDKLPPYLNRVDSFHKLKLLGRFWFLAKQRSLRINTPLEKPRLDLEAVPEYFTQLPFSQHAFTNGSVIKNIDQLLELEKINPLLTYFFLSRYENIRAVVFAASSDPLEALSKFKTIEVVEELYNGNPLVADNLHKYCVQCKTVDDFLKHGQILALLLGRSMIKKNILGQFIESIFHPDISLEDFIVLDKQISPVLFDPYLCTENNELISTIYKYLSRLKISELTKSLVDDIEDFESALSKMRQHGPFLRLKIALHEKTLALVVNEDQLFKLITVMCLPKILFQHFFAALPERLSKLPNCTTLSRLTTHCYGYSNKQVLETGLFGHQHREKLLGHHGYLEVLIWRAKCGQINSVEEAVDLLKTLYEAANSRNVNLNKTLMSDLEKSILCFMLNYLEQDGNSVSASTSALPDNISDIEKFRISPKNNPLYLQLKSYSGKNQSLSQRCLLVLCRSQETRAFFSPNKETSSVGLDTDTHWRGQNTLEILRENGLLFKQKKIPTFTKLNKNPEKIGAQNLTL